MTSAGALYVNSCQRFGVHPEPHYLRNVCDNKFDLYRSEHAEFPFEEEDLLALCSSLRTVRFLYLTNLKPYAFSSSVADILNSQCVANRARLVLLDVSCSGLTDEVGEVLAELLVSSRQLRYLNLAHNMLGRQTAAALSHGLSQNSTLYSLDVSGNIELEESFTSAAQLANGISSHRSLHTFISSHREKGALAISECLECSTSLTTLALTHNALSMSFATSVASRLLANTTLTCLQLGHAYMGPESGVALAECLCRNSTVTSVGLRYNCFGLRGGLAFASLLGVNRTLTFLNLAHNDLKEDVALALKAPLSTNPVITSLILDDSTFGPNGSLAVRDALSVNRSLRSLGFLESIAMPIRIRAEIGIALERNIEEQELIVARCTRRYPGAGAASGRFSMGSIAA